LNYEDGLIKTYEATPEPRLVVAVGNDACDGGIFKDSYAVIGGVERVVKVDTKIPGDPPSHFKYAGTGLFGKGT
jgi:Ni,Fe-hydrogenase III small subunit